MLLAVLLGFLAGLRTFTAPAVLLLMRRGTPLAYTLGVLALAEYAGDLYPKTPARTGPFGLIARACSGGFCGWTVMSLSGSPGAAGALAGAVAAVIGAYVGLAGRSWAIGATGRVPAALLEDVITVAGSVAAVAYL
ncbi:MAG: hypothetical protein ABSF08_09830 [Candidatus Cybelea sp.]|jgi:uncharacterized membrane protein